MDELKVGESVTAKMGFGLSYTVTNTGWTLTVASTRRLSVVPNADGSVSIVCPDLPDESEVGG